MQLYEAKQAKRVVTEPINTPRTKKINGSFFGFRNLGEGLCDEWAQIPSPRLRKPKKVPSPPCEPPFFMLQ